MRRDDWERDLFTKQDERQQRSADLRDILMLFEKLGVDAEEEKLAFIRAQLSKLGVSLRPNNSGRRRGNRRQQAEPTAQQTEDD